MPHMSDTLMVNMETNVNLTNKLFVFYFYFFDIVFGKLITKIADVILALDLSCFPCVSTLKDCGSAIETNNRHNII